MVGRVGEGGCELYCNFYEHGVRLFILKSLRVSHGCCLTNLHEVFPFLIR